MLAATSLQFTHPGGDDRMQSPNPYAKAASAGLRGPDDASTRPSWVLASATRPRGSHESSQGLYSSTSSRASSSSSSLDQQPYLSNPLAAGPATVTPVLSHEKRASPGTSYAALLPQEGAQLEMPAIRFGGSSSEGARNDDLGGRIRRLQYTNYSRHSYGEEDFEFLRSLLQEAGDPRSPAAAAAAAAAAAFPLVGTASATASPTIVTPPGASSSSPGTLSAPLSLLQQTPPPPLPFASSPAIEARVRRTPLAAGTLSVGGGGGGGGGSNVVLCAVSPDAGGRDGDVGSAVVENDAETAVTANTGGDDDSFGYEVTAEDKLRAADDVAACIWLAGEGLREGLIARVRDTWGAADAEMTGMACAGREGSSAAVATMAAQQRQSPLGLTQQVAPRKNFRQVLVNQLESTRKAVEAELKAADEAASVSGGGTALCDPRRWRGRTALREDVLATLKGFQAENDRDPTVGEYAFFSTASCREELLQRLRRTRDAVVAKVIAANGAGASGSGRGGKIPAIIGDVAAIEEVDGLTKGLLEQLEANHAAAEEERKPSESSGDLREGLLARLESTRAAAAAELLKAAGDNRTGVASEAASATGTGSDGGGEHLSDGLGPQGGGGGGGMWERGGRQDGAAGEGRPGASSPGEGVGGGVAGAGTRKRRRAGNGGRRCKHEGCTLHPHFGLTRPEYCSRHKLSGMFNVKGRQCVDPDCKRTPVYGKAGDPHPTYCAAHKLADMVDIKNPTCREPTCPRQPSFGSPHDRRATYCASHMLLGMVNVRRMLASSKSTSKRAKTAASSPAAAVGGSGGRAGARRQLQQDVGTNTISSGR